MVTPTTTTTTTAAAAAAAEAAKTTTATATTSATTTATTATTPTEAYNVIVRTLGGSSVSLDVSSLTKVADIKHALEGQLNVPASVQALLFETQILHDSDRVQDVCGKDEETSCERLLDLTVVVDIAHKPKGERLAIMKGLAAGQHDESKGQFCQALALLGLHDADATVRQSAIAAVACHLPLDSLEASSSLLQLSASDEYTKVRTATLKALVGRSVDAKAAEFFAELLEDPIPQVQQAVLEVLPKVTWVADRGTVLLTLLPTLVKLDEKHTERRSCLQSLLKDPNDSMMVQLSRFTEDPDPAIHAYAVEALAVARAATQDTSQRLRSDNDAVRSAALSELSANPSAWTADIANLLLSLYRQMPEDASLVACIVRVPEGLAKNRLVQGLCEEIRTGRGRSRGRRGCSVALLRQMRPSDGKVNRVVCGCLKDGLIGDDDCLLECLKLLWDTSQSGQTRQVVTAILPLLQQPPSSASSGLAADSMSKSRSINVAQSTPGDCNATDDVSSSNNNSNSKATTNTSSTTTSNNNDSKNTTTNSSSGSSTKTNTNTSAKHSFQVQRAALKTMQQVLTSDAAAVVDDVDFIDVVASLLESDDPLLRCEAARLLPRLIRGSKGREAAIVAIEKRMRHPQASVRRAAASSIVEIADEARIRSIAETLPF